MQLGSIVGTNGVDPERTQDFLQLIGDGRIRPALALSSARLRHAARLLDIAVAVSPERSRRGFQRLSAPFWRASLLGMVQSLAAAPAAKRQEFLHAAALGLVEMRDVAALSPKRVRALARLGVWLPDQTRHGKR